MHPFSQLASARDMWVGSLMKSAVPLQWKKKCFLLLAKRNNHRTKRDALNEPTAILHQQYNKQIALNPLLKADACARLQQAGYFISSAYPKISSITIRNMHVSLASWKSMILYVFSNILHQKS